MGKGLTDILREASREYDLIVVDAPPILGFAEPLQIATAVDGVVVVTVDARAGGVCGAGVRRCAGIAGQVLLDGGEHPEHGRFLAVIVVPRTGRKDFHHDPRICRLGEGTILRRY